MLKFTSIDNGTPFDWGKTSADYAKYRDIYPQEFYQKLLELHIATKGQNVLDLATGTGVIPRNMYQFGANFIGIDISENQIEQAKILSAAKNMDIKYVVSPVEDLNFPHSSFDSITACQCFWYFDTKKLIPFIKQVLKPTGKFVITYFNWVPFECEIAKQSEQLVLKYNPSWNGCNMHRPTMQTPGWVEHNFKVNAHIALDMNATFTRESWNGRIRACRGIGASLTEQEIERFSNEHLDLLNTIAPPQFDILHVAEFLVLQNI